MPDPTPQDHERARIIVACSMCDGAGMLGDGVPCGCADREIGVAHSTNLRKQFATALSDARAEERESLGQTLAYLTGRLSVDCEDERPTIEQFEEAIVQYANGIREEERERILLELETMPFCTEVGIAASAIRRAAEEEAEGGSGE